MATDINMTSGTIAIRTQDLICKIQKIRDKQWEVVNDMQSKGYDISSYHKNMYEDALNLFNCYDSLLNYPLNTEADINYLEWVFNNGKLRSDKEVEEYNDKRLRTEYHESSSFIEKLFLIERHDYTINRSCILLTFILAPIIPAIISFDAPEICAFMFAFTGLYSLSLIAHMIILLGIALIYSAHYEKEKYKEYSKTDEKYPVPKEFIAQAGAYTLLLFSVFKKKSK